MDSACPKILFGQSAKPKVQRWFRMTNVVTIKDNSHFRNFEHFRNR